MKLTIEQIKSILAGAEESLRLLQSQPEYQALENRDDFTTPNDLVLGDAIQALSEIYQASVEFESDFIDAVSIRPETKVRQTLFDLLGN